LGGFPGPDIAGGWGLKERKKHFEGGGGVGVLPSAQDSNNGVDKIGSDQGLPRKQNHK